MKVFKEDRKDFKEGIKDVKKTVTVVETKMNFQESKMKNIPLKTGAYAVLFESNRRKLSDKKIF